jgi:7-cyano-7-deazaguanine synthase
MKKRNSVIALVSGGVESLCMVSRLLQAGNTVQPVYVRCGFLWEPDEQAWLSHWLFRIRHPRLKRIEHLDAPMKPVYGDHWSFSGNGTPGARAPDSRMYLPGRNVLLLGQAAVYGAQRGYPAVAIGTLAGNPFGDATPGFFRRFAGVLRSALAAPVRILTPVRQSTKSQLLRLYEALPLHLTFSCVRPASLRHCGRCNKCAERRRAFRQARIHDRTDYAG